MAGIIKSPDSGTTTLRLIQSQDLLLPQKGYMGKVHHPQMVVQELICVTSRNHCYFATSFLQRERNSHRTVVPSQRAAML